MAGKRARYANLDNVPNVSSSKDFIAWRKERRGKKKDFSYKIGQAEVKQTAMLAANRTATTVTWIGHSTFLIQIGGLNIVTDPVWARSMAFERRLSAPGLMPGELPEIDVVLLSHSHYDHLDLPSLRRLAKRGSFRALVPAGLGKWMQGKGFTDTQEFDWWESTVVQGIEFHFVPSQHWTRRSPLDTNTSHWGGWVMQRAEGGKAAESASAGEREEAGVGEGAGTGAGARAVAEAGAGESDAAAGAIYFAGDSGYFRGFQLIGEKFRIHTALMPIGAYEPEWFMSPQHVTPEEAIQAFLDVKAELMMPMHYGAFPLADDTPKEALDRLHAEWSRRSLSAKRLVTPLLGETIKL